MTQKLEIWCILQEGKAPKKFTIVKHQLNHISNSQVEAWIKENIGYVEEWWA
jgi:hypothetical protein